jgi:hypothetical protein
MPPLLLLLLSLNYCPKLYLQTQLIVDIFIDEAQNQGLSSKKLQMLQTS